MAAGNGLTTLARPADTNSASKRWAVALCDVVKMRIAEVEMEAAATRMYTAG
jgi:hypothetical protein